MRAFTWPPERSEQGRLRATDKEEDLVRSAIGQILTTSPGERLGRPTFGCELRALLFAPADEATAALVRHRVREALRRWEPRAAVRDVAVALDEGRMDLAVRYVLKSTGRPDEATVSI